MKIHVICKVCGETICQVSKPQVSDADLLMYEQMSSCENDGGNSYEYDEDGNLLSSVIKVIAIRLQEE